MVKQIVQLEYEEFKEKSELSKDERELVEYAIKASENAHAIYSNFSVGAAVSLKSGKVLSGNNRENAAFPSGTCAENTVIAYAGANYPNDPIISLAIAAKLYDTFTKEPVPPCGKCRQIIVEEEERTGEEIRLMLYGTNMIVCLNGISPLLPLRFNKGKLAKNRR